MARTKNRRTGRAAKDHAKQVNDQQSPSFMQELSEMAESCQDEDLRSRMHVNQRSILALDKYYNFTLFVGEGDQAIKRAKEYMQEYREIIEESSADMRELACRQRVRDDISWLTRISTENPRARIFPPGSAAPQKAPGPGTPGRRN